MKMTYRERRNTWNGLVYRIRDLVVKNRVVGCEVAYRDSDGLVRWKACEEGVEYASIPHWSRVLRCKWPEEAWQRAA